VPVAVDRCPGSINIEENVNSFVVIVDAAFSDDTTSVEWTVSSFVVTELPISVWKVAVPVEIVEVAIVECTVK
jgi:hypothetical protein